MFVLHLFVYKGFSFRRRAFSDVMNDRELYRPKMGKNSAISGDAVFEQYFFKFDIGFKFFLLFFSIFESY